MRQDTFSITCNAIKSGIDGGLIRRDIGPVEVNILLTLIVKGLTEWTLNENIYVYAKI
ncbi:hypothetical protein [Methanosarcina spelaei]|uniref:hypothetical protein n=1 Tax=Methanosarcina spelaei TaxID=1036679 RepID=UPI001BAED384|nr:hypothetical protein [Methanosarcina spelaei]